VTRCFLSKPTRHSTPLGAARRLRFCGQRPATCRAGFWEARSGRASAIGVRGVCWWFGDTLPGHPQASAPSVVIGDTLLCFEAYETLHTTPSKSIPPPCRRTAVCLSGVCLPVSHLPPDAAQDYDQTQYKSMVSGWCQDNCTMLKHRPTDRSHTYIPPDAFSNWTHQTAQQGQGAESNGYRGTGPGERVGSVNE
jgi:hypothetical protein